MLMIYCNMLKNKFLLFIILFFLSFSFSAQNIDSLITISYSNCKDTSCINAMNICSKYYRNINIDTSVFLSNQAFFLSKKIDFHLKHHSLHSINL